MLCSTPNDKQRKKNALIMQPRNGRRLVLFPAPFQGHINPMLQLANILYTNGFQITVVHIEFNSPNSSNYPHFTFKSISDGLSKITGSNSGDASSYINYLMGSCVEPFKDCVAELLHDGGETLACVITDAFWHFTQAVTDGLKIPTIVLQTSSLFSTLVFADFPRLLENGSFGITKQDSKYEALVPEFPHLKYKDIVKSTHKPQVLCDLMTNMVRQMKASSGLIWNTFKELEEPTLETISHRFRVPSFTLGPFHKYFLATSSSLIEQDRTILSWLDAQAPKSVVYVSFGSLAQIAESDFQEVAYGLANVGSPFLWVVRPGVVDGSEWLELLPEKFWEKMGDRGRIVKWSPQQDILAHPATGCFWTHNGWNSTLESICEGVPMICSPCLVDQLINARYVSDVWKNGVLLEDGFERNAIERAIKRVMVDKEGEEMRERIFCLKEKINLSLEEGGSSYESLENLVNYILSF